jgi:hypothetical protein
MNVQLPADSDFVLGSNLEEMGSQKVQTLADLRHSILEVAGELFSD